MAYTYTRTINVQPSGSSYTWTNPASSWITITQQGTSDSWNIEIADNTGNTSRSATLTVTHEDGVTSDTINVSQAAAANNPTPVVTATPTATPTPTATIDPTVTLSVTKGQSGSNWSISSMSIDSATSSDGVTATGFGLGTTGGGITASAGDLVVIKVNMSPNDGREWYSASGDYVESFASGDISSVTEVNENLAFQNGGTSMAMYTFSFVVPEIVGPTINVQIEASTQASSNAGTISFGAVGTTTCGTATVDTYSYEDTGVFVVGDSITGALPNSMGSRVVTAATGSAAAQVGKVFAFMEDEIMGISDCTTPDPTATRGIFDNN